MPEKMGIEMIMELRENHPDLKIIAMSAGGDFGPEIELDMAGAFGGYTITKPFDPGAVLKNVNELLADPPIPEEPSGGPSGLK